MQLSVESWRDGELVTRDWEDAADDVVFVSISCGGHKIRCSGYDNYALLNHNFYAWTDPWQSYSDPFRVGSIYVCTGNGIETKWLESVPHIPTVQRGIMLDEADAREVGLV